MTRSGKFGANKNVYELPSFSLFQRELLEVGLFQFGMEFVWPTAGDHDFDRRLADPAHAVVRPSSPPAARSSAYTRLLACESQISDFLLWNLNVPGPAAPSVPAAFLVQLRVDLRMSQSSESQMERGCESWRTDSQGVSTILNAIASIIPARIRRHWIPPNFRRLVLGCIEATICK